MGLPRWVLKSGFAPVLLFSLTGFLTMGYHPGAEDDGVYLAAVKAKLNPTLFPHDAAFFKLQMQATMFDTWMAGFVRTTHISIAWSELLWQAVAIVLMLWACGGIASRLFEETAARWAAVASLAAMLTLPVAGTALYLADPYLHPRNLASGLILLAVTRVLARRWIVAASLLTIAILLHPMMGIVGVSFCLFLAFAYHDSLRARIVRWRAALAQRATQPAMPVIAAVPLGWLFRPPSQGWIEAMKARHWFWLYQWTWYEWLGALGPLLLFWLLARWARGRGEVALARFSTAVLVYGVFQQMLAMVLCGSSSLVVLSTLEPMRYLHLVYVFMVLLLGGLLGRFILKARVLRWAVFLLVANGVMFAAQRHLFPASPHIEFPGQSCSNPWLQAFAAVRRSTPPDAYFALGPTYLGEPREDMHSFRALAERSVLADAMKDGSVVSKAPDLVPVWRRQVDAQSNWNCFQVSDFTRLKAEFGVDWVLLDFPPPKGLTCSWQRRGISVCRIPD